jgi:hypothetical protein
MLADHINIIQLDRVMPTVNRFPPTPDTRREPLATIIVTPRERFSMARRSLESVIANTAGGYRLVLVAGGPPADVRQYLTETCSAYGYDLILRPDFLVPNSARNIGLAKANTKYIIFLDNDVIVEPEWLNRLVACAEEEGADFVSPLCLQGEIAESNLHTMGGSFKIEQRYGEQYLTEEHLLQRIPSEQDRGRWKRLPISYTEFHCALVRRSVFDHTGPLDEKVVGTTEHIDFAFQMREAGCRGLVEPNAVISFLPVDYTLGDLPTCSKRWSDAWLYPTLQYIAKKWEISEDSALLRDFNANYLKLRERCLLRQDQVQIDQPASPRDFFCAQTIAQLLDQMEKLGYRQDAREKIRDAYLVATELFSQNRRASGRPALSHLIGVASIVAAFGANPTVVAAAVLHSAYTVGRFPKELDNNPAALRRWLKRRVGEKVEAVVLAFFGLQIEKVAQHFFTDLDHLPIETANAIVIRMANGIEDRLCGDEHTFDPATWLNANNEWNRRWMPIFSAVADRLGVLGLTALLRDAIAKSELEARNPSPRPARPAWFTIDEASWAGRPSVERPLSGFFAPTESDKMIEEGADSPPLAVDLAAIVGVNDGSVFHSRDGVTIVADPRPWAYSGCLPLQDLLEITGPGKLEIRLEATRGRIGALVMERGSSVNEIAPEQFADSAAGIVTLCFRIPAFEEIGNIIFRGWPCDDGETRATIFQVAVRNKTAKARRTPFWRHLAEKGHKFWRIMRTQLMCRS